MPTYATPAELANFLAPEPLPAGAGRLLARASRDVQLATVCAVYAVDDNGLPTDAATLAAMKEATLEQAVFRIETGDDTGVVTGGGSAAIGSVNVTRTTPGAAGSGTVGDLGGQAFQVLFLAGLTGQEPASCG